MDHLSMRVFCVGHGDCIVLRLPDGEVGLAWIPTPFLGVNFDAGPLTFYARSYRRPLGDLLLYIVNL